MSLQGEKRHAVPLPGAHVPNKRGFFSFVGLRVQTSEWRRVVADCAERLSSSGLSVRSRVYACFMQAVQSPHTVEGERRTPEGGRKRERASHTLCTALLKFLQRGIWQMLHRSGWLCDKIMFSWLPSQILLKIKKKTWRRLLIRFPAEGSV